MPRDTRVQRMLRATKLLKRTPLEAALIAEQTDYDSILDWLHRCLEKHSICYTPREEGELPTRLIDVGSKDGTVEPRLVNTSDLAMETGFLRYLTLSYCWGKTEKEQALLTTTDATLLQREQNIPSKSMPKTFRQAIDVCRGLQVQYLWIDALCILQDNPTDWESESSHMEHTYRNALCCLVASHAADPHGGLFITQIAHAAWLTPSVSEQFLPGTDGIAWRQGAHADSAISEGTVGKRGWCLQERYLSPRLLHFTKAGLLRECNDGIENGATDLRLPPQRSATHSTQRDASDIPQTSDAMLLRLHHDWCNVIQEYRSRSLTRPSDALPAISGLAREIASATGDVYVAGHWQTKLPRTLSWYVWRRGIGHPPEAYRAPSWSWASLDNRVMWDMSAFQEDVEDTTSLVEVGTPTADIEQYGGLENDMLVMHGPLTPLDRSDEFWMKATTNPGLGTRLIFAQRGEVLWDSYREAVINRERELFWLVLWRRTKRDQLSMGGGLLLVRELDKKHQNYIYKRTGYMYDEIDFDAVGKTTIILG